MELTVEWVVHIPDSSASRATSGKLRRDWRDSRPLLLLTHLLALNGALRSRLLIGCEVVAQDLARHPHRLQSDERRRDGIGRVHD